MSLHSDSTATNRPKNLPTQRYRENRLRILIAELATFLLRLPLTVSGEAAQVSGLSIYKHQLSQPGPWRAILQTLLWSLPTEHLWGGLGIWLQCWASSSSARLLVRSGCFLFFSLLRPWAYCPAPVGSTLSNTSLNADIEGYIWPLWVSTASTLGLCQWLCMGAWGGSLVSQQNCLTEERGAWCGHSMQMNITFFCKAALEHLTCGIWGRGQLFVYTYS